MWHDGNQAPQVGPDLVQQFQAQQRLEPRGRIDDLAVEKRHAQRADFSQPLDLLDHRPAGRSGGHHGEEFEPGPIRRARHHHCLAQPETVGAVIQRIDLQLQHGRQQRQSLFVRFDILDKYCPKECSRLRHRTPPALC